MPIGHFPLKHASVALHGASALHASPEFPGFAHLPFAEQTNPVSHAPLTLWATKEGLRRIRDRVLAEDTHDLVALCYTSDDFREGVRAFMERRKPIWRGQ